ncbi:MAG TPA: OmpA family protein, partial [Verrucomicrobiales bacterium]|nr:OmpA family protein [Verrucomicrobiales bacterium]
RSEEEAGDKGIEFTATYEADLLILKGNLEGESTFADIEAKLTGIRSSLSVKNELSVSAVRPGSEWVAKLPDFFAEVVGRTKSGVFAFGRDRVELTGRTIEIADRMILQNITVNTVPSSFLVKNELLHMDEPLPLVPISAEAAAEVNAALKELPVYFESGSSILTEEGRSKIAGVVERLKKANAEYALILTGVSDNIGNAATNKELSLARADSVVKELVKLEIPESVIEVTSEVENVSNLPRSQRWKSRRVDFSLKSTSRGSAPPAAEPR